MLDVRILALGAMALLIATYGASTVGGSVSVPKSVLAAHDRIATEPATSDAAGSLDPTATGSIAAPIPSERTGSIKKRDRGVYIDGYHLNP